MHSKNEISNFKLLVHPIGQDRSGQKKAVHDKELISRKKAERVFITDDLTVHFGQCIPTKDDPFVRSVNNRVLATSIRLC